MSFGVHRNSAIDIATENSDCLLIALGVVATGWVLPNHKGGENPGGTVVGLTQKWDKWREARGQTWSNHHVEDRAVRSCHRYLKHLFHQRLEWAKSQRKASRSLAAQVLLDPAAPYNAWALAHLIVHDEMGAVGYPEWASGVAKGMRDAVRAQGAQALQA